MKRKKLAAFGLVIALTASSSSAAFAAAVPAAYFDLEYQFVKYERKK